MGRGENGGAKEDKDGGWGKIKEGCGAGCESGDGGSVGGFSESDVGGQDCRWVLLRGSGSISGSEAILEGGNTPCCGQNSRFAQGLGLGCSVDCLNIGDPSLMMIGEPDHITTRQQSLKWCVLCAYEAFRGYCRAVEYHRTL